MDLNIAKMERESKFVEEDREEDGEEVKNLPEDSD